MMNKLEYMEYVYFNWKLANYIFIFLISIILIICCFVLLREIIKQEIIDRYMTSIGFRRVQVSVNNISTDRYERDEISIRVHDLYKLTIKKVKETYK